MLSLLEYRAVGEASYRDYFDRIHPFLERVGAPIVCAGECSTAIVAQGS